MTAPATVRKRLTVRHPRDVVNKWIVTSGDTGAPLVSLVWQAESVYHPRGLFEEITEGQRHAMRLQTHSRDDVAPLRIEGEIILADDYDIAQWISWAMFTNTPVRKTTYNDPEIYTATAKIGFPVFLITGVTMAALQFLGVTDLPPDVMYAPLGLTALSFAAAFSGVFHANLRNYETHVTRNVAAEAGWATARTAQTLLTTVVPATL
jgi:hypothetical protein